uniref:(northern house mosquito) hypothetical protein n=1 Tax=Culex pipiens TaxID=7175 RepID=A0A8D8C6E6_CULPI
MTRLRFVPFGYTSGFSPIEIPRRKGNIPKIIIIPSWTGSASWTIFCFRWTWWLPHFHTKHLVMILESNTKFNPQFAIFQKPINWLPSLFKIRTKNVLGGCLSALLFIKKELLKY